MKNVIVTGANGFIGNSLIKKLIENNVKVVAVDISFAAPRLPETDLITKIEATVD
ncbi:MAG: NAD-dependent epimerase/dehydratase family protein, partial [Streptococcus sp.]